MTRETEIARVFDANGPFASIYLATPGNVENAAQHTALRWKNLRDELAAAGVTEAVLGAIDPLVADAHTAGATLAVIAGADGVLFSASFAEPPARDARFRFASLPYVVPLLARLQAVVPYVAVLTDRTGADIVTFAAERQAEVEHVAGPVVGPQLTRSAPGGWSQPRYQHRAEVAWERNAGTVAERLTRIVDRVRPRFVAAAGDVRALQLLRDACPKRVAELTEVVGGELLAVDDLVGRAAELVERTVERDTRRVLEQFSEGRGQGDRAASGAEETFAALERAQVATLLVGDEPDDERLAWFGEEPTQLATTRDALVAMGVGTPAEGRLIDVAVRAALGGGAAVRVVDPDEAGLDDRLGALLRYTV